MPHTRIRRSRALDLPTAAPDAQGGRRSLPGAGRRRRQWQRGRGAHGFAGLRRPRRETPAAQRGPDPAALAAAAQARSLGRRVTWPGRERASPARVTL